MTIPDQQITPDGANTLYDEEMRRYQNGLNKVSTTIASLQKQQIKFYHRMDEHIAVEDRIGPKLACKSGCNYCCHFRVEVRAPEAFTIAVEVLKMPESKQISIIDKLEKNAVAFSKSPSGTQMHNSIPCAFLSAQNSCSIYDVRPGTCRSYHALDVQPCATSFFYNKIPVGLQENHTRNVVANMFIASSMHAQRNEQYDSNIYELSKAVLSALKQRAAFKRWKSKQKSFV